MKAASVILLSGNHSQCALLD